MPCRALVSCRGEILLGVIYDVLIEKQMLPRSCRSEDLTETRCAIGVRVVVVEGRLNVTGALAGAKV